MTEEPIPGERIDPGAPDAQASASDGIVEAVPVRTEEERRRQSNVPTATAALMAHAAIHAIAPADREAAGVAQAAAVLATEQHVDLSDTTQARLFARAVHEALEHRSLRGLDFSENSTDVARMTLAAWSLDRIREEAAGLGPRDPDVTARRGVYATEVCMPGERFDPSRDRRALLDGLAFEFTRAAVLTSASSPHGPSLGATQWEQRFADRRTDEERGFAPFPADPAKPTRDEHVVVIRSTMEASARRRAAQVGSPAWLAAGSEARRPFPVSTTASQKGLLAAEAWHESKAGRPLREYELRMLDSALDRFEKSVQAGGDDGMRTAARTILLDSSIQMSARRTADAGDYGRASTAERAWYDDVIAASAGTDLHREGVSPDASTTDAIAQGRFSSIPDGAIAASIADGLAQAAMPYSQAIESEIGTLLREGMAARAREDALIRTGTSALERRGPEHLSKGPSDVSPVLGAWTTSRAAGRG